MTTKSKTTKTKARNTARRRWVPMPPRGMRHKLDRSMLTTIGIVHMENLDEVSTGRGTEQTLWDMVEAVLTWSNVAMALKVGVAEMKVQFELVNRVIDRYGRTGRVGFTGAEYQMAKLGVQVMDELAHAVDKATALEAAHLSNQQLAAVRQRINNRAKASTAACTTELASHAPHTTHLQQMAAVPAPNKEGTQP
jgi:hypothetical protein